MSAMKLDETGMIDARYRAMLDASPAVEAGHVE